MAADFATTISLVNGTDVGTPGLLTEYEQCIQNKYPNTSYEWEKEYEYVSYGVLLNAIGLLGILGNILSTMALIRPKSRINSFNYLLLCLVSWDTVLIVLSISLFGIPVFSDSGQPFFEYYFHTIYPILTPKVLYPVACIAQTSILFLTLTITLERFVAISYPMKAKSICTTGRTHMIVMCVILFSIIYNIPRFFEFTTIHKYDELSNKTILQIEWTELRCNHNYISFYINWLSLCFLSLLPFSILAVLNTSIYLKVRKGNSVRSTLPRVHKRMTVMLFWIVLWFFVCNFPAVVTNILEKFFGIQHRLMNVMVILSNLLLTTHASVNFIIYIVWPENFRRTFLSVPGGTNEPIQTIRLENLMDHQNV